MILKSQSGMIKEFLLFVFLSIAVILVGTVIYLMRGSGSGTNVDISILKGTPLSLVAQQLNDDEIVSNPLFFKFILRFTQGAARVRAGEFRFQKGMRPFDALRVLYFSEAITYPVTIPEGWTVRQIAKILSASNLANEQRFISLASNPQVVKKYNLSTPSLEGFLFPDTYHLSKGTSEEKILDVMVNRFFATYNKYRTEAVQKGYTVEKLVTLASIIEKETGAPNERPLISAVFHNRLKKKMRLQSDPTTIYGIPNFNGNLTKADLKHRTPYNTYTIGGLPLGPIANPGEASLVAALNPADVSHLYFVSRNDGTHIFSDTYREHNRQVTHFQKRRSRRKKK